jgi:hypothetical protein
MIYSLQMWFYARIHEAKRKFRRKRLKRALHAYMKSYPVLTLFSPAVEKQLISWLDEEALIATEVTSSSSPDAGLLLQITLHSYYMTMQRFQTSNGTSKEPFDQALHPSIRQSR